MKAALKGQPQDDLLDLIRDLYRRSAANRRFLHARCGGPAEQLDEYRRLVTVAIAPDPLGTGRVSLQTAKRAIRGEPALHEQVPAGIPVGVVDARVVAHAGKHVSIAMRGAILSNQGVCKRLRMSPRMPEVALAAMVKILSVHEHHDPRRDGAPGRVHRPTK